MNNLGDKNIHGLMPGIMSRKTLALIVSWLMFVAVSFAVEYYDSQRMHKELILSTARSLFERIVLTRRWNAMHGGVYVPVTKETQPNPYLEDPMRDIKVNDKLTLTKINPAYMTRQLAELSEKSGTVKIHLTSLRPLRPENKPDPREQRALESFERGVSEIGEIIKEGPDLKFFYMAPLRVEKSCMACHAKHGYEEGDVRGGISILTPVPHREHLLTFALGNAVMGLLGVIGIIFFGVRLDKAYEIIRRQSITDPLTGLANRRQLDILLEKAFAAAKRGASLSVIMFDIDHFKEYNDTYGHAQGDQKLVQVAQAALKETRQMNVTARYGGEEFIMLLSGAGLREAYTAAERLRAIIESDAEITVSLGIASYNQETTTKEDLIAKADEALYKAKEKGRNRVECWDGKKA